MCGKMACTKQLDVHTAAHAWNSTTSAAGSPPKRDNIVFLQNPAHQERGRRSAALMMQLCSGVQP